jgi:hypothetical protein
VINQLFQDGKIKSKTYMGQQSVVVPFITLQGDNIPALQFLTVDGKPYPFTEKHGSPANKVFGKGSRPGSDCFFIAGADIQTATQLIICESVINAITAYECFPNSCCIALGGSTYVKKVNALKPYMDHIKKVIVCVDNDEASEKMLRGIWEVLGTNKVYAYKWDSDDPEGCDHNDLLQAGQKERIIELIQNADNIWYAVEQPKKALSSEQISSLFGNHKYKNTKNNTSIDISKDEKWLAIKKRFPKGRFPWEVLPRALGASLKQLARSCATSATHLPGIVFCVLSAVLGRHVEVMVKESWSEPLIFWMLSLLPSGEGKTPAQNALCGPLFEEQELLDRQYKEDLAQWDALGKKEQKRTPKPEYPGGIFTTNVTIEGLRNDQRPNGGCLVGLDEATSFFDSQNQYRAGKGTDRQEWLKLYDGKPARIVRVGGAVFLKGARISIVGGTQPEVFWGVFNQEDNEGDVFLVDGTLFRFMMTYEQEQFFPITLESWDTENQEVWSGIIKNALKFCHAQAPDLDSVEEIKPHRLWLSEDAQQVLVDWANDLKGDKHNFPVAIRGYISKLIGWVIRLSGIIRCLESFMEGVEVKQIIDDTDLKKGIKIAEFYMGHNIDVMISLKDCGYKSDKTYSEQEVCLAKTLQELTAEIDNGRLAIGFIYEKFNENCLPETKLRSSKAMGSLIRSCGLSVTGGKHNANGKRAVLCLEWDEKTKKYIEACLQCLQSLQSHESQGFQDADIINPMSAMSAINWDNNEKMQTLQTSENQCLQTETAVNKGYTDIADIADIPKVKIINNGDTAIL